MGSNTKQRVIVVAPGRGCYNKDELGYLKRFHSDKTDFIAGVDEYRTENKQRSIAELDGLSKYSFKLHTPGENASALIYACAYGDFLNIDRDKYEIVAVTGNSMGWYIALALSGVLPPESAIQVINTMGSMMETGLIGGQIIYPEIDENWQVDPSKSDLLDHIVEDVNQQAGCELYTSIYLGGYRVLAGNEAGLKLAEEKLPQLDDRYPMRLYNHGAFHTPLLKEVSKRGFELLDDDLFERPDIPLVDGQGNIWSPYYCDLGALRDYTFGHQVTETYDFSKAVEVAVKEFAPDKVIVLGPGNTLAGPVAQELIKHHWFDWKSKQDFADAQMKEPLLMAMGHEKQRELCC